MPTLKSMPINIDTINTGDPTNQPVSMENGGGDFDLDADMDMESLDRANAGSARNELGDG